MTHIRSFRRSLGRTLGGVVAAAVALAGLQTTALAAGPASPILWNQASPSGSRPTAYDWVALYAVGAPDWAVKAWKYTGGTATGSTSLTIPWGTPPGNYEVRLFANNSYTRIGTAAVTVIAP